MDCSRAELILDSIGDAVLSTDQAWLITYLNPVAERMLGWTLTEARGRHLTDVFCVLDGESRERIVPNVESAVQRGETVVLPPNCILVRRDGHESHIEDSAAPIHDEAGGFDGMVIVFHDVGAAQAMSQKMAHLAEHDVLTALPNRALLDDRLAQAIALASRYHRQLAVLFVDLDHFKGINDSLGHLVGDQLLKAVAERIKPCVRHSDTVSRQGGDEFIVVLTELNHPEDAGVIAEKVRLAIIEPFSIAGHYLQVSTSIGISVYPGDGEDAETLISHADTAMYHAKEMGKNRSQFFKEDMNVYAAEQRMMTGDLQHALARGEFFLHFQPKLSLIDGGITGVEALLRWRHPDRGVLHASRFIAIAEDCGLMIPIGRWVLKEACSQAQRWIAAGLALPSLSVNVSSVEFRKDDFVDAVCSIVAASGLAPALLQLELTEATVMRSIAETDTVLRRLNDQGIRITIDHFGTGYTNLSHLKRFPVTALKLARSSVAEVPGSADAATIVRSVMQMAHSLALRVIADGVDNAAQLAFFQAHDCEEAQGDYLSPPVDADDMAALLADNPLVLSWLRTRVAQILANEDFGTASPSSPPAEIQEILLRLSLDMRPVTRVPPTAAQVAKWRHRVDKTLRYMRSWAQPNASHPMFAAAGAGSQFGRADGFARRLLSIVRATERSSVAVTITDASGAIVWVNDAFSKLCGYTLEEAVGKSPAMLLQGQATDAEELARLDAAIRRSQSVCCELVNYTKDGAEYSIALAIDPVWSPTGDIDAFVGYSTSIARTGLASAVDSLRARSDAYARPSPVHSANAP